jgi:EAL domain-containing protein (putative c-di-GMP-specific phosphodiesterase class I)
MTGKATTDSMASDIIAASPDDAATRQAASSGAACCCVVDDDLSVRQFLSLIMHGAGVDTVEFEELRDFRAAVERNDFSGRPPLVFIDIALDASPVIDNIVQLGQKGFKGPVQLMSLRGAAVLEHVNAIGKQYGLTMLPVLKKPFDTGTVVKIIRDLKIGAPPAVAARIDLEDALKNNWVEFWYQPKIDLRRKQLAGAEAYARVRHPQHGILAPVAFLPGAQDADLTKLAILALKCAIRTGEDFSQIGLNLRLSINMPARVLQALPMADIIRDNRVTMENWPGLLIDVPESELASDLPLAREIANKLAPLNIKLALDDFGRSCSSLARLKDLPFAELKLDRTFVNDCGVDRINAPLCKTVIDLAHSFRSAAVAVGIEKAADAQALISMGCDFGLGHLLGQPMPGDRFISLIKQRAQSQGRPAGDASVPTSQRA